MKPRIMFWLYANMMYFGLAKYIQDAYDCELYSIIDITNKTKPFFQSQGLVKFEKMWFYHDHITYNKRQADMRYLDYIEKKYNINLWLLATNERSFFQYNEYHRFTTDEICLILEQECRLFEKVLDEVIPDFLIMATPSFHHDYLFYHMCRHRGIKVLIQGSTRIPNRSMISEVPDKIDATYYHNSYYKLTLEEMREFVIPREASNIADMKTYFLNSKIQYAKASLSWIISDTSNTKTHYTYFGRSRFNVIKQGLKYSIIEKYRKHFIESHSVKNIPETPYAYFPLSTEPESTLLLYAPFRTNQLELIKNVAKSLPINYKLAVKEHPLQELRGWRSLDFYRQLTSIPNAVLLHPSLEASDIIKQASMIITVSGTSAMQGAFYLKPSLIFADTIYSDLPAVRRLRSLEELPQAIHDTLSTKVSIEELNGFVDFMRSNTFEFNLTQFDMDYTMRFFHGGYLVDVKLDEPRVSKFLNEPDIRQKFELIASEHIKKMKNIALKDIEVGSKA